MKYNFKNSAQPVPAAPALALKLALKGLALCKKTKQPKLSMNLGCEASADARMLQVAL